jgi:outer membrane protein
MLTLLKTVVRVAFVGLAVSMAAADEQKPLTLQEAHELAIQNNPRIVVADLKALIAREVTRETMSAYYPTISANAVAVGTAESNTRLEAIGALNNPSIFDRNAEGLMVSQLITDFGKTANLTGSARFRAEAQANNTRATREQILLATDSAFYGALQAQSVLRVAEQTVTARNAFLEQVSALATNKLRSDLDVSFARVNLEDARLLLSKAQNDLQAAFAELASLMGAREPISYRLVEQPLPMETSNNVAELVQQALSSRPDLLGLRDQQQAAVKFARGEKALRYPTISAVGSAGVSPVHDAQLPDHYAAAGVVVSVPLFAGGYNSARQHAADLEAQAAEASVRDLENNIIRDVRISWLNTQNALDRFRITGQLLQNAQQSYTLAQARYKNGLSSIVEFEQAELNLISAQISHAATQYEYLIKRSTLSFQTGTLRE